MDQNTQNTTRRATAHTAAGKVSKIRDVRAAMQNTDGFRDTAADVPHAAGRAAVQTNPDATSHELLNEATEWLQYARGVTGLLMERISEMDLDDIKREPKLVIALEGVSAMMNLGVQCAAEAHSRMGWERAMAAGHVADGQPSP